MIEAVNAVTRPLVTVGLVGALIYGFLIGRIGGEQFFTVVTMVVGFWFGQRATTTTKLSGTTGAEPPTATANNGGA